MSDHNRAFHIQHPNGKETENNSFSQYLMSNPRNQRVTRNTNSHQPPQQQTSPRNSVSSTEATESAQRRETETMSSEPDIREPAQLVIRGRPSLQPTGEYIWSQYLLKLRCCGCIYFITSYIFLLFCSCSSC